MNKKLRIAHFPQVPCEPFYVHVSSLTEAHKIMSVLARYDHFQYHINVKPDYSNASVLQMCENGEWLDWEDEETGIQDLEEYFEFINEIE